MTTEETKQVLLEHAQRYPFMQPQDVLKLLYQSEFGTGHMIDNAEKALNRLNDELKLTPADKNAPLLENIGGYSRLSLAAAKAQRITAAAILERFIAASQGTNGSLEALDEKIMAVKELCRCGVYCFDEAEFDSYYKSWLAAGGKSVSHSDEYRKNYSPAYRVVR